MSAAVSLIWGIVLTVLSLLAWGGQAIAWLFPSTAVRWKLLEAEQDVEPAFWADSRAEALWDTFTLWTMVAAGVLLIADADGWAYFGLVGGGMYLYFGGRGISARVLMIRYGLQIGTPSSVRVGIFFCTLWAITALITIVAAVGSLTG